MPKFAMTEIDRARAKLLAGYVAGQMPSMTKINEIFRSAAMGGNDDALMAVHVIITMTAGSTAERLAGLDNAYQDVNERITNIVDSMGRLKARLDIYQNHALTPR